jgi:hypothetical protein
VVTTATSFHYNGVDLFSDHFIAKENPMARKVQVVLEDDVDGGAASESVLFGLDGRSYEIDLNDDNARDLRDALAPWVASARIASSVSGGTARNGNRARRTDPGNSADIRRWAQESDIEVSERGRISADLRARYEAAH